MKEEGIKGMRLKMDNYKKTCKKKQGKIDKKKEKQKWYTKIV